MSQFFQIMAYDENQLSLAIVDSTGQIRAKCDFRLEDMQGLLKNNLHQWELVKNLKFMKEVSTDFFFKQNLTI